VKVTSYRELMAQQAKAAVTISGAHHSSFGGHQKETEPGKKIRGSAGWDNSISYSRALVTEPAQEMFRNARAYNQDPATLKSYREAVKTMLHENVHMLAAEGADHSQAVTEIDRPGVRPLEEGITELYSQQKLNDYIDELGLEEIAPGLKEADAVEAYPKYRPAAQTFADSIGRRSGLDSAEVISRMAVVTADQKFRVAAETIYDHSELPQVVPSDQREAAVRRIEASMKQPFGEVDHVSDSEPERRRESAKAGAEAAKAGYREVAAIQKQWTMPAPEMQRAPQSQQAQQTRGTDPSTAPETRSNGPSTAQETRSTGTPPVQETGSAAAPGEQGADSAQETASPAARSTGGGARETSGAGAGAVQEAARSGVAAGSPQQGNGAHSPELQQAMRAGLGGSAPLSGVSRLSEGEQGSRRSGAQPAQQRQGPEREA
jgi:hypothetical protein